MMTFRIRMTGTEEVQNRDLNGNGDDGNTANLPWYWKPLLW